MSLLALGTLVSILYVADVRVREGATHIVSAATDSNATQIGAQFSSDTSRVLAIARDQSVEHGAITGFVAVAGVLLLFMLKT